MLRRGAGPVRGARSAGASVAALPFAAGTFDAVLAMHMLYHAPDVTAAVVELRRVLRPGGVVLASTLSGDHLRRAPPR